MTEFWEAYKEICILMWFWSTYLLMCAIVGYFTLGVVTWSVTLLWKAWMGHDGKDD